MQLVSMRLQDDSLLPLQLVGAGQRDPIPVLVYEFAGDAGQRLHPVLRLTPIVLIQHYSVIGAPGR